MSKTEADLLHFQNRTRQLEYLLNEEKEKNKELFGPIDTDMDSEDNGDEQQ
jgi:hypothetical protein